MEPPSCPPVNWLAGTSGLTVEVRAARGRVLIRRPVGELAEGAEVCRWQRPARDLADGLHVPATTFRLVVEQVDP